MLYVSYPMDLAGIQVQAQREREASEGSRRETDRQTDRQTDR